MERYCSERLFERNRRNKPETTPQSFMNSFAWKLNFPSMHGPTVYYHLQLAFDAIYGQILYTHGQHKPFRSLPVFKRECIFCFLSQLFFSLAYLSTAVLYPCFKCRYLVHVNDLSHILKRGVRYLLYIVAIHIRIDL